MNWTHPEEFEMPPHPVVWNLGNTMSTLKPTRPSELIPSERLPSEENPAISLDGRPVSEPLLVRFGNRQSKDPLEQFFRLEDRVDTNLGCVHLRQMIAFVYNQTAEVAAGGFAN
nr:hypothetical protein [Agrobacterium vitis]